MKKACALCLTLYVMAILLSFISGRFFVVSDVPAHYRPPHVLFYEGPTGAYLVLEWGGPLLGRFGIAYDPGRKVIQEYTHVHECADSIFAVSKR